MLTLPLQEILAETDIAAIDGDEMESKLLLGLHVEDLETRDCITLLTSHC